MTRQDARCQGTWILVSAWGKRLPSTSRKLTYALYTPELLTLKCVLYSGLGGFAGSLVVSLDSV